MNDNLFHTRFAVRPAFCLSVLVVALSLAFSQSVRADVALPPPTAPMVQTTNVLHTSHNQQINGGWRGTSNVNIDANGRFNLNVPSNVSSKTTYGSSNGQVATKTNPVRVTGQYGEVVRGTVTTSTKLPPSSTMGKVGGGLMATAVVGGALNSQGERIGSSLKAGDYRTAASAAVEGVLETLKGMGNFVTGGLISGAESVYKGYTQGTIAAEVGAAAQAKAEAAAQAAQAAAQSQSAEEIKSIKKVAEVKTSNNGILYFPLKEDETIGSSGVFKNGSEIKVRNIKDNSTRVIYLANGNYRPDLYGANRYEFISTKELNVTDEIIEKMLSNMSNMPKQSDFMLTEKELANILAPLLQRMLDNQQANHTELINTLSNLGALPANTPENTSVTGTEAQNTFLSEPYTPKGGETAQQTAVTIKKDGGMRISYIPRPDLGAGTSQAPIRSEVGKNSTGTSKKDDDLDVDIEVGDDEQAPQAASQPKHCEPETKKTKRTKDEETGKEKTVTESEQVLGCLPAGSDDYKDLEVLEKDVDLSFNKKDYFKDDGQCPAPVKIQWLGTTYDLSYEPFCKMAAGVSNVVELLGVLTAVGIAYGAIREI